MYIVLCLLTGAPSPPIDLRVIANISNTETSGLLLQWPSACTCPTGSKDISQIESGGKMHEEYVPQGFTTYFFEKPLQEDAIFSVVRENQCGLRSSMSNHVDLPGNCKWILIRTCMSVQCLRCL